MSYGEVAEEAGFPGAARAVGNLLRAVPIELPWWRVVGWDGTLRSNEPIEQAARLRAEGVAVEGQRVSTRS